MGKKRDERTEGKKLKGYDKWEIKGRDEWGEKKLKGYNKWERTEIKDITSEEKRS